MLHISIYYEKTCNIVRIINNHLFFIRTIPGKPLFLKTIAHGTDSTKKTLETILNNLSFFCY